MPAAAAGTELRSVVVSAASICMRPRLLAYSMAPAGGTCCDGGMDDYGPATYGDRVADVYDEWYDTVDPAEECALLAELAGGGRVLELGIGTGRIALPLAAAGIEVQGVDSSPAMVKQLQAKPGGAAIPVTIGDMADVPVDGEFSLVFVVFSTFFMLTTEEAQQRCFRNAAAQRCDTTQIRITESGIRLVHARLRYAHPPELDEMAHQAGLELESRWA